MTGNTKVTLDDIIVEHTIEIERDDTGGTRAGEMAICISLGHKSTAKDKLLSRD